MVEIRYDEGSQYSTGDEFMTKIVLASNNLGKVQELQALFSGLEVTIIPQSQLGISSIEETGLTFIENALLKARHAAKISGLPALADDSGLEVDVLGGAPGVHSARYAGDAANANDNIEKLLAALKNKPASERTARFQCVLVYMTHPTIPSPIVCQGSWEGSVLSEQRGAQGFGYDPIFWVPTHHCSAAELPMAEKNRISHRAQALQALLSRLQACYGG